MTLSIACILLFSMADGIIGLVAKMVYNPRPPGRFTKILPASGDVGGWGLMNDLGVAVQAKDSAEIHTPVIFRDCNSLTNAL